MITNPRSASRYLDLHLDERNVFILKPNVRTSDGRHRLTWGDTVTIELGPSREIDSQSLLEGERFGIGCRRFLRPACLAILLAHDALAYGQPLAELLDSADFINRATISRAELQHGVRDLTGAGLIGVGPDPFALTEAGRQLWEQLWRDYEKAYARTGNESAIRFAEEALGPVTCAAKSPGWSVSQREWDDATAAFHATFAKNLRELDERRRRR